MKIQIVGDIQLLEGETEISFNERFFEFLEIEGWKFTGFHKEMEEDERS